MKHLVSVILISILSFSVQANSSAKKEKKKVMTDKELDKLRVKNSILSRSIRSKCDADIWCYQKEVVKEVVQNKESDDLCLTINNFYRDRDQGVVSDCFRSIALKNKNCKLCEKITVDGIKENCEYRVCGKLPKK